MGPSSGTWRRGAGRPQGHKSQVFLFSLRESFTSSLSTGGQLSSAQLEGQLHPNISGPIASTATSTLVQAPLCMFARCSKGYIQSGVLER